MNNYYVYIYLDPRKPGQYKYGEYEFEYKPFYIGKGKNKRYKEINWNRNPFFKNKMNKIKKSSLEPIIKLFENLSEKKSLELEIKLIEEIKKIDSTILVNMTDGGEGISGYKFSEESREIISKKCKKDFCIIKDEFERRKYKLLTKENEYKNCNTRLKYICQQNHENFTNWNSFRQGNNCPICYNKLHSEKLKGENGPNSILIIQDVIQIKLLLKEGNLTQQEIADIFEVSRLTISAIKTDRSWSHVKI